MYLQENKQPIIVERKSMKDLTFLRFVLLFIFPFPLSHEKFAKLLSIFRSWRAGKNERLDGRLH
jgi:hypothetical protein